MPKVYAHVWDWFIELYSGEPITYTEIMNWSQLTHQKPKVSEVKLLKRLESAYRQEYYG